MYIGVITIFPEMFKIIMDYGITKKAIRNKIIKIRVFDLRNYSENKKKRIDNKSYGPGGGMVFACNPLFLAITEAKNKIGKNSKVIYLSPQGKKFDQKYANSIINKNIIFICGRYEGIDERIIKNFVDEELSIGDYILTGGELASMVIIDALTRLIPGALNNSNSVCQESFSTNFLDYPHYTRPRVFRNLKVPSILLSGNHSLIKKWRRYQSIKCTLQKRPELLKHKFLSIKDKVILKFLQKNLKK